MFQIWDIVFGTFRTSTRAPQEMMQLGLRQVRDACADRLPWLLGSPLCMQNKC